MKQLILLTLLVLSSLSNAQNTQVVRGIVIEKDTRQPVIGASITLLNSSPLKAVTTDMDGKFKMIEVPVGPQSFIVRYLGFADYPINHIDVNSAKELILNIEMESATIQSKEVEIIAHVAKDKPLNEMSMISARTFSVEETQRYATSANDVGRMAMGFAGVQPNKDNNNDVVIRGNSPVGVMWRLEGIEIPNPNHFARKGSTGGGISIISGNLLDNSDFSTGAFAAEYGNAFSGVFDLKFRKGNNEKRENTFRAGLLGLDFATEGPFKKGGQASYLVNYRYSTLGILNQLGFSVVGKNVSNNYQDLCFNFYLPTSKHGVFTVFGVGGVSYEYQDVPDKDTAKWFGNTDYTRTDFKTKMGAFGVTHLIPVGTKSYIKTVIIAGGNHVVFNDDTVTTQFKSTMISNEDYKNGRIAVSSLYNRKMSNQHVLRCGVVMSNIRYGFINRKFDDAAANLKTIIDDSGNTFLLQGYAQVKSKYNAHWSSNFGVHSMFLTLNNTYSIEPRAAATFHFGNKKITAAYGLHSQIQPLGNYFTQYINTSGLMLPNLSLPFTKAHHLILAYDYLISENLRLKLEPYYQYLFHAPIGMVAKSTYFILNERNGYAAQPLKGLGTGINRGLDLTFEKFYSQHYFFLLSASLFDSKYRTETGVWYNTKYNTNYSISFVGGGEKQFKNGSVLEIGTRMMYMGGQRYSPVDIAASTIARETVRDESKPYTLQIPAYWRIDLRIAYKTNRKKFSSQVALDIQNLLAHKNIWQQNYDVAKQSLVYRYQQGLIPVISYRIYF